MRRKPGCGPLFCSNVLIISAGESSCGVNKNAASKLGRNRGEIDLYSMRDYKGGLVFSFYQRYRGYLLPVNSNIRHRIACKFSVERFHTSACDYNRADAPV